MSNNKKDLAYYKANAEEDYLNGACLSVLRYISELESELKATKIKLKRIKIHKIKQAKRLLKS